MEQGNSLYILKTELIDKKVEISVNNNLAAVHSTLIKLGEQIADLRHEVRDLRAEMHKEIGDLRVEMNEKINSLAIRLTAVETILGIRLERQTALRQRFLDFSFKLGWVALFAILTTCFTIFGKTLH
jgi:hypothetical protein